MSYKGTFKGTYSPDVKYSVGDVVIFENEVVYHLQKEAAAGTPPTDTRFWGQVEQDLSDAVKALADSSSGGGSGGGGMVIHMDEETGALDKTWQEIYDAVASGTVCTIPNSIAGGITVELWRVCSVTRASVVPGGPEVFTVFTVNEFGGINPGEVQAECKTFDAVSADGYPQLDDDDSGPA